MDLRVVFSHLKRVDWEYLVNRWQLPLFCSLASAADLQFRRHTRIPVDPHFFLHTLREGVYVSQTERQRVREVFERGGVPYLRRFAGRLRQAVSALERAADRAERTDATALTQSQLVRAIEDFGRAAQRAHTFLNPMPIADRVLSQKILERLPDASAETKTAWLAVLAYPIKENAHTRETRDFLRLVRWARRGTNMDDSVRRHVQRWGWIGARSYFWHLAWTDRDVTERISAFIKSGKDPSRELAHLSAVGVRHRREYAVLLKQLGIRSGSELHRWIVLAQEFAFLRTWRTDAIYRSGYRSRELFYEAARRAGLRPHQVGWLLWDEVLKMARTGRVPVTTQELRRRMQFFAIVGFRGRIVCLSGLAWRKRCLPWFPLPTADALRGNTAYPGKVRGQVKVVRWAKEVSKVRPGDILVAVMTFPHFVPAMEKAAAFVTDEGGILCHAAIVAREMRKPCIIATKNATRVLKNGDRVEVDATKGIVRKI